MSEHLSRRHILVPFYHPAFIPFSHSSSHPYASFHFLSASLPSCLSQYFLQFFSSLFSRHQISGLARGAGARGQGILTASPEKSVTFFTPSQKNWFLSLKISDDLFSHHPIFLDQSLHTGFAPLFTQLTNETPHFAPPLQIVLQKYLPQFSLIIMKKL